MTLESRLHTLLQPHEAVSKRMFGGTCFMVKGNMVIGTLKKGLLVRVGKQAHEDALKRPGAKVFDMTGRPILGYIIVEESVLASNLTLQEWVDLGLAFTSTLPPKPVRKPAEQKRK